MFKIRPVCYRLSERKGQTMTEYALLLAGIAVAAVAGYNSLGAGTNGAVNAARQHLASSSGSPSSGAGSGGSGGGDTGSGSGHHHGHHGGGGFGGGPHGGGFGFGF